MAHKATWAPPKMYAENATEAEKAAYREEEKRWRAAYNTCADCGSTNVYVENYDMRWQDGDVMCDNGHRVRGYDAG